MQIFTFPLWLRHRDLPPTFSPPSSPSPSSPSLSSFVTRSLKLYFFIAAFRRHNYLILTNFFPFPISLPCFRWMISLLKPKLLLVTTWIQPHGICSLPRPSMMRLAMPELLRSSTVLTSPAAMSPTMLLNSLSIPLYQLPNVLNSSGGFITIWIPGLRLESR